MEKKYRRQLNWFKILEYDTINKYILILNVSKQNYSKGYYLKTFTKRTQVKSNRISNIEAYS